LRRTIYGVSCVLSGYDAWQTNKYVNNGPYIEHGRLGSGPAFFTVKAGLCIAPIVVGETTKSELVKYLTLDFSAANSFVTTVTIVHNNKVLH